MEVVDDGGVAPPRDRDEEVVEQPEHGDHRGRADEGPDETDELLTTEDHGAAQEVRADRNQVVLEREPDRTVVGRAVEPALRQQRVNAHQRRERDREHVDRVDPERKPSARSTSSATRASATPSRISFHAWIAVSALPRTPAP